ncbi:FtsW/RodA/SpoVE family cell cycle protein [Corynebacterium sp. 153RC1]|uniref:FtsW/RodA/SpoVE family cell cycle protein n=1 Tax=unclassified Corynebacterium TaxID=2624378 RepID=UPI00211C27FB|nr:MULTISPECIES: FtsW/RodA/SpoVE family cell cycle protein [unclassified Corynebacterium]MCQ9370196.1 FtsW/RodA/SpoVE family cell cycle protein [Corynebacterium sp. 35RC1]MCQ9352728.1 FtsW/RodA/SpoVE family cell cycle protein [Corynebacterium sp. 209RC1]MCQ9354912.1 FtsW/RodA/SpoVE family cell cycle protein [Corynebacterium sp. 1222RC1]MCQ9357173.1 FtsW/RodA/SpoVE family cell cycle protein [Corynebacterium sp. 122RC1]MCQ9359348.1 FtsW/RodA/SpoVE family cell cycle protein [Corynebacterium sp. 1
MTVTQRLATRRLEFGLLVCAALIIAVTLVSLNLAQGQALTQEMFWVIGGFLVVFTIAHLALCFTAPHADQVMLPVASVLNGLGLVMVYRLDLAEGTALANRQVMWSLVAVALMVAVLVIIRDHRVLTRYSYVLGLIGLVLLALPLVWPASAVNADARIWISIGPFSVQPGEFSKILLLLFFAQLLVTKRALFTVAGYRFLGLEFPRLRDLAPIIGVWGFAILIMAGENDFGPALLLFSTVLGMIYLATGRASWLMIGAFLVALGGTAVYQVSDKIQARFSNFQDPVGNYDTTGYQLSQALFGMSTGGISGTGIGAGHPQLVPVAESDFILAAIGEELGLIGLSAVLVLFAIFVTRGMRTALLTRDSYGKLVASGLSLTIAIQVFVVTAGISALLPMTGLTTPFMSQGGSSLMANYILLGLILRISDAAHRQALSMGTGVGAGPGAGAAPLAQEVRA